MKRFDPWTATIEEGLEYFRKEDGISAEHMAWVMARGINARRSDILAGTGRNLLDTIAVCARYRLALAPWLADAFLKRYRAVSGYEVASWDDPAAFGRPHPKGVHINVMRKREGAAPVLEAYFQMDGIKRDRAGYAKAAKHFRLSTKQVRAWLPKTRRNHSKSARSAVHQPADLAGVSWNAPFTSKAQKSRVSVQKGPLES